MEKTKLDRIIGWIREEMMTVGNTGYQSGGDQTRAGYDPVQGKLMRRKRIVGQWSRSLRGKKSESK